MAIKIDKLNKGQKITSADATSKATDKSSEVQKDHAKFLHESLELPTQVCDAAENSLRFQSVRMC